MPTTDINTAIKLLSWNPKIKLGNWIETYKEEMGL